MVVVINYVSGSSFSYHASHLEGEEVFGFSKRPVHCPLNCCRQWLSSSWLCEFFSSTSNNSCYLQMDMTWQNILPHHIIFCDLVKYSVKSFNNIHMVDEYTMNIPWHGMEYAIRFFLAHLNKLTYSCSFINIIGVVGWRFWS